MSGKVVGWGMDEIQEMLSGDVSVLQAGTTVTIENGSDDTWQRVPAKTFFYGLIPSLKMWCRGHYGDDGPATSVEPKRVKGFGINFSKPRSYTCGGCQWVAVWTNGKNGNGRYELLTGLNYKYDFLEGPVLRNPHICLALEDGEKLSKSTKMQLFKNYLNNSTYSTVESAEVVSGKVSAFGSLVNKCSTIGHYHFGVQIEQN